MTRHDDLVALLRQAMPPVRHEPPPPGLWPRVVDRRPARADLSWLDLGAAATIAVLLALFPWGLWFLVYHL